MDEPQAGGAPVTAAATAHIEAAYAAAWLRREEEDRIRSSIGLRVALTVFGVLGVLGVLAWVWFWAFFNLDGPDPLDTGGAALYLDIAEAWAVGSVALGVCRAYVPRWVGVGGSPAAWLVGGDLGLVTALLWPLQAFVGALLYTFTARHRSRPRRVVAALIGAAVLFGGGVWGVTAYAAEQPWQPAQAADASYLGVWKAPGGATLDIRPHGVFVASGFSTGFWPLQLDDAQGSWSLSQASGLQNLTLTPDPPDGDAEDDASLDIYGQFSPSTLCLDLGPPGDTCDLALHR